MRTVTVAEVEANFSDFADSFSDLYKGLHGFRPRGYLVTAEMIANFFNNYDEELRQSEEQDALELENLGDRYGRVFHTWSDYYDMLERKDAQERAEYFAEKARKEAEAAEFARRGSPMPFIIDWEHGRNEFRV